jgi:hypothetical protein
LIGLADGNRHIARGHGHAQHCFSSDLLERLKGM